MLSPEIMSLIHQLELSTKVAMRAALVGDTRQRDLGFGSEFDQIREYSQGDDIRFIDWRGFARTNKLLVRQYRKQISKKVEIKKIAIVKKRKNPTIPAKQFRKLEKKEIKFWFIKARNMEYPVKENLKLIQKK